VREGLREDGSVELADIEICKVDKTARLPVPWDAAPGTDPMYAVSQWPTRAMYARRRAVRAQSGVRAEVMGGLCGDKRVRIWRLQRDLVFFLKMQFVGVNATVVRGSRQRRGRGVWRRGQEGALCWLLGCVALEQWGCGSARLVIWRRFLFFFDGRDSSRSGVGAEIRARTLLLLGLAHLALLGGLVLLAHSARLPSLSPRSWRCVSLRIADTIRGCWWSQNLADSVKIDPPMRWTMNDVTFNGGRHDSPSNSNFRSSFFW
jgi:hypothetical protein